MISTLKVNTLSLIHISQKPTRKIEGEHSIGIDGFMEFHADQAKLEKLVLDTFYLPHD